MLRPRTITLIGAIVSAALFRLIPHPWNMTPVAAMALFSGARFARGGMALVVPLAAMVLSDLVLGFHPTIPFVYGALALTVLIGRAVRFRTDAATLACATLAGSLVFFLVTNFGHWLMTPSFPRSAGGLIACYAAAIPFFRGTLFGDLFFSAVFFGGFALAERRWPVLRVDAPRPLPA